MHRVKYSHMGSGVLQKTTVIYHSLLLHQEMQPEPVTRGESYTTILCSDAAGISGPELISESQKHSGNVCCAQMSPHFNLFLGKMDFEFSVPSRLSSATEAKANVCRGLQWGKKVFSQPPIVQVLPLKKMREACNFHHRYTSTMRDKIRKKNPENHIVGSLKKLFANYGGK